MCGLLKICAGILEQSMGARNRVNWVAVPARQASQAGEIDSLESIPGLLNSLKIPSLIVFDFLLGKAEQISALAHGTTMPEDHLVNGFNFTPLIVNNF